MSRLFDGVDDQMVFGSSVPSITGAVSMLIVVKVVVTTDNTWLSFIETESGGGAIRWALGRRNNGDIYAANGAASQWAVQITDSDAWAVVGFTKASGSATPRMHKCLLGSASNTHTNAGGTLNNDSAAATIRIGGNDDFANIKVAAAALFNVALADADFNAVASAKTTQSIANLSPVWLVDDSDAFATDLIGSADRTSITGTADDADDPSGWVYGLGGATDFPLDAQPGSYTVTGTAATPLAGRQVSANPGTYAVTGTAATLPLGRFISAAPGSYALTGSAAGLLAARALNATPAAYTATGVAATTAAGRSFTADPGSYTLTGIAADLLYEQPGVFELNAETGVLTVTGQAAGLLATRLLNANPGSYTLPGSQAGISVGRAINAQPATLVVTGLAATFPTTRLIIAGAGAYTVTGIAAEIAAAGQAAPTAALLITFREPPQPSFQESGPATHREYSLMTFREGR